MSEATLSRAVKAIARKLPLRRRRQFWLVIGMTFLGSIAELATFGAIIPFLTVVSQPDGTGAQIFRDALQWLGIVPPDNLLLLATAILITAAIGAAIVRLALLAISRRFIFGVGYDLGVELFARALQRPYIYYLTHNSSEILSGVNKVQVVLTSVVKPGIDLITAGGMSLVIIAALIMVDPMAAMFAAVAFCSIYLAVSFFTRRKLRSNSRIVADAHTGRLQAVQEGVGGIRDIILDRSHGVFLKSFAYYDHRLRVAQASNHMLSLAPRYAVEAAGVAAIALLALYMADREGGLLAAVPTLGALAFGAQRLLPLVQQVYAGYSHMTGAQQAMQDVVDLLEGPEMVDRLEHRTADIAPLPFAGEIAFSDVTFRYPEGDRDALSGIDLVIPKGTRVGFIGKTGSGKSTLIDMVMGLIEPVGGSIAIDGQVLGAENRAAWQAQVAHVPQVIFLSDDSLARNIAFGESGDIDMERVREAARRADIDAFIQGLPEQYETVIGERGVRLSGGQRQRIGIARALYKQASVLVLDEATSALDDQTEAAVMEAIDALGDDLTILMIAHRLTTVRKCDRVVRLEQGRVAAIGSFEDVVAESV